MATTDGATGLSQSGHKTFYEFACYLCESRGKHVEASKYCKECVEASKYCKECLFFMCDPCVNVHNEFPSNRRHELVDDQGQFNALRQSQIKSFPTERCAIHPEELVNTFCGSHDIVCCSVCKALDHSHCTNTQHISDAANGIKASKEYRNTKQETQDVLRDIGRVLARQKADISRIAKEKHNVQQTIADFRERVNLYLDNLELRSLNELDAKEMTIVHELEERIDFLEKTKDKIADDLKQIELFNGDNDCELFCYVKSCKNFVRKSMSRVQYMSAILPNGIKFKLDQSIEKDLRSYTSLGSFESVDCVMYEAKPFEKVDVTEISDTKVCDISCMCQASDGSLLITDTNNMKLKRLDQSYKLLDSLKLPGEPFCVCATGPQEAAVSLCNDRKVQFVSVGRQLSQTRSIYTESECIGMVYTGDKLYVCCGFSTDSSSGSIKVYNDTGHLQYSLPRGSNHLSAVPKYITCSDDGKHLLVTSIHTDKISMLDLDGNVVDTFSSKEVKTPTGICTDGRGHVFVCGFKSHRVAQISPKYQRTEVIPTDVDVIKPLGIFFDKKMSRLLISCNESKNIMAYTCTFMRK